MNKHAPKNVNTPPVREGYLCVGVITNVHGIKGEVVVKPFTDDPLSMASYGDMTKANGEVISLRKLRLTNKGVVAFVDGVRFRDEAEKLKRTYLYVAESALPVLEDDNAYMYQLEGMNVVKEGAESTSLGQIENVFDNGAHAVVEVRLSGENKVVLIPFIDEMVLRVDVESNTLTVTEMVEEFLAL